MFDCISITFKVASAAVGDLPRPHSFLGFFALGALTPRIYREFCMVAQVKGMLELHKLNRR